MRREGFASIERRQGSPQLQGVLGAVRHWRSNRRVFQLLLGTMLIQMAIFVVVTFTTPILADRFGQSLEDLLWLLLIIHVVAVPSTLGWSHLMTGAVALLPTLLLLASWGVVLLLLAFGSGPWMPLVTVTVIGCCLGATFSGLRGFLAESVGDANPVALFALATVGGPDCRGAGARAVFPHHARSGRAGGAAGHPAGARLRRRHHPELYPGRSRRRRSRRSPRR